MRDGARRHVDNGLVPGDHQVVAVGDLTDVGREHIPFTAHRHECVDVVGCHDRAHAFLGFAGQDLGRGHPGGTHRHLFQVDVHATVTGGREF